ncbi:S8 family peptidase [Aequorivita vladivostokensis]|uniref:Peptidase S8 n=1 Tax=Aequorivita vladivostokensis TaxID=171194 RepID=A0ABR5DIL0_9FLAO|nr:S8 family peptidase [Aequorivita vladivostokensis]KJJ38618.1 peptidase S8 [Aequorivita vladivostokensis]HAV55104.1 peptidase S8 [Aequorivita sp.]|tara:strand:+ start:749 stop:2419 length:1671 start_codon:yes stop_codon:yes gene_type:complete
MNIFKTTLFAVAISTVLAGCGSGAAIVATPIQNIDSNPLKITPLTEEQLKHWPAMDLVTDTVPGMSVDKAYSEIIKKRKGETVIVGVIDSGVDIDHEDLKNVIWTNPGEIAGNGIDDDNNGFVDDIHGWNFLGNITGENMEYVRIIRKLKPKYEGKSEASISAADREEFALYQKAQAEYEKELREITMNKAQYEQILAQLQPTHEAMAKRLGKEDYTKEDLSAIQNPSAQEQQQIAMLSQMLNFADSVPEVLKDLKNGLDYFDDRIENNFNMTKDFRSVLGDNPEDIADNVYGDNNVAGPDPTRENVKHGTHVAGIIAAQRNNGIGMDGVANNVKIMAVRAVPDGDEYDKDIALAIRYAVDNGAKVLNTSFGKYYSPQADWVYDAIKYAASKDVLIVNAAGNDGLDLDTVNVYPNDQIDNGTEMANSFLTVGALNYKYGSEMVANFSNYGKTNVDVFAPGVKIWATTPLNTYEFLQGTSMAAPEVAGVAAMIRSYYPSLSAAQVKQILMDSGLSINTQVVLGGEPSNTDSFANISKSGKMVNMYNALIMADKMANL